MATILATIDDIEVKRTGEHIEATGTVRLALGPRAVELDLNVAHHKELAELLEEWLDAGRPVPGGAPTKATGGRLAMARAANLRLKEWADADPAHRPYTENPVTKKIYWPVKTRRAYETYLRGAAAAEAARS